MLTEIKWFAEMTKIFFILLSDACSVTRYGEISPLWHDVTYLWPFWKGSVSIWQNVELANVNFIYFGQVFIVVNGQLLKSQSSRLVTMVACDYYLLDMLACVFLTWSLTGSHLWPSFTTYGHVVVTNKKRKSQFNLGPTFLKLLKVA